MTQQSEPLHHYRKNAWNDDQYNASDEKGFHTETLTPTRYQFKDGLTQTEADNMVFDDHKYRKHAWTEDQHDSTHPKGWTDETDKPTGYLDHIKLQTSEDPKPTISYVVPWNTVSDAWQHDHFDHMNSKEFEEETNKPSGYQAKLGALSQTAEGPHQGDYPKNTKSTFVKASDMAEAWTGDQFNHMDEKAWTKETTTPSGYIDHVKQPSLAQRFRVETKSTILPYDQRDHAWNTAQYDNSNLKDFKTETTTPSNYQVTPTSLILTIDNHPEGLA